MVSLLWQDATCYRLIDYSRSVSEGNLTANDDGQQERRLAEHTVEK